MNSKPGMTYNEYAQEIGKLWRGMCEEDKQAWQDLAHEDKVRYNAEMANYKAPPYDSDSDSDSVLYYGDDITAKVNSLLVSEAWETARS